MNHFVGIGRLTRDPEVRYTQSGKACAKFTLAIDDGADALHDARTTERWGSTKTGGAE